MQAMSWLDVVTNLGALGILAVYFLYTQPKMQSETLGTFKELVREYRAISVEQDKAFTDRVGVAMSRAESLCRYRGEP